MLLNVVGVIHKIVESTSPNKLTVNVLFDCATSLALSVYKLKSKSSPSLTILVVYNGINSIGDLCPA